METLLLWILGTILAYYPTKLFLLYDKKNNKIEWTYYEVFWCFILSIIGNWIIVTMTLILILIFLFIEYLFNKLKHKLSNIKPPKWL